MSEEQYTVIQANEIINVDQRRFQFDLLPTFARTLRAPVRALKMSVKRPRSEPSAPVASTSKVLRTSEAVTSAPAALAPIFAQKLRFSWFDPVSASPERPATCLFGRSGSAKLGKSKIAAFDLVRPPYWPDSRKMMFDTT